MTIMDKEIIEIIYYNNYNNTIITITIITIIETITTIIHIKITTHIIIKIIQEEDIVDLQLKIIDKISIIII